MSQICPLCNSKGNIFFESKHRIYHQCNLCFGLFMDTSLIPNPEEEKNRYLEHHNDVNNPGYQKFVSPITNAIFQHYSQNDLGLDFGAGTGPVITKVLTDNNYKVNLYDPFFHNSPDVLNEQYDYIVCCEVIEHFHQPAKEFQLLKNLLLPNGKLYCMTSIYDESIDFRTWYYKDDQTHVFIYHHSTLDWIKNKFAFSSMTIKNNLIIFSK